VSGLAGHYEPEDLVGTNIIVVANLKPVKLRGVLSEGMLLAASKGKKVGLLFCPDAEPGTIINFEGINPETKEISIDEFFEFELFANKDGVTAEGKRLVGAKIIVDKNIEGKVK
jgi:methionyl-tRNA synthetase